MKRVLLMAAILAAAAGSVRAAETVTLVADGKPVAAVYVDEKATPSEKWAAEELTAHIKQISGAELKGPQPAEEPQTRIFLGLEAAKRANPQASIEKLGPDGFIIEVIKSPDGPGGDICIYGTQPRGTLYGVYTLLESLGVRWWTPTETYLPEMKTIAVPVGRTEQTPRLEYRDMMYYESFGPDAKLWFARNKLNGFAWDDKSPELMQKVGGRYRFHGNLVHSYNNLLRASGVKMEPQMWAQVNGKPNEGQPCLTNEKVFEAITAEVTRIYKADPALRFVVVGQNDNRNYCRCEKCQALIDAEGESGPVIQFANRVAERVEKEVPGAVITTAAYEWSRKPPKTLRPRHNVYITLCSIECDFAHSLAEGQTDVNKAFREDIQAWSKLTNKLLIWDYVTNYWRFIMPHPNFDVLTPNVKFFADNGAAGVFEQAAHTGKASDLVALRMWVLAKALWNPDADNWTLINEFVDGYYGPAAPGIKKYLEAIQKPVRQRPDYVMRIYRDMDTPYLAPAVMAEAEVALRQAAAAVKDDELISKRVRHARMGVWYITLMRGPQSNTWKAIEEATGEKLDIEILTADFLRMAAEQGVSHAADGSTIKPFLEWLPDYARQVKATGVPLPSELQGRAGGYRLIQASQVDRQARWLEKCDGASDGWAMKCPTVGWVIRHAFDEANDFEPGSSYRLMVRAKGTPADGATGPAWQAGVSMKVNGADRHVNRTIKAEEMTAGQWQSYEILRWKPQHGDSFWICLRDPKVLPAIYYDCIWLEKVDE